MGQVTYQVIARRWRPKQFSELVGQDHIVRTLSNAIEKNRIAHAYLFVGPKGTGKTSTARLFAKALNCTGGPSIKAPEDCPICQAIMQGVCLDVIEIDGASNNSVDQVRDLRDDCQYAPSQARFKIYIIDEVHMLSTAAFNALLKTLEEPPAHVVFIFATTEAHKVLPTIVSRCQRFEFRPIADSVIIEKLKVIAEAEGLEIEDAVFASIARLACGGMRDAQSILDQLISFCGGKIVEEDIVNVYGLASAAEIRGLAMAMVKGDYVGIIRMVAKWDEQGKDFYRVLQDLQLLIHEALMDVIHGGNRMSEMFGVERSVESWMRMLEVLRSGEQAVCTGLSEKVNFELTLLKAVEQSRTRAIDSLIKEITVLKDECPEDSGQKKNTDIAIEEKVVSFEEAVVSRDFLEAQVQSSQLEGLVGMGFLGNVSEELECEVGAEIEVDGGHEEVVEVGIAQNSDLGAIKARLSKSTLDILEDRFRGDFKFVKRYNPVEWLMSD